MSCAVFGCRHGAGPFSFDVEDDTLHFCAEHSGEAERLHALGTPSELICAKLAARDASKGSRVAASLERALRNAPEATKHAADAVIVFDVLRRWYGDGAKDVLTAALELAKVEAVR